MYSKGFRITENAGNNSFSYYIRKSQNPEPKIYLTNLIQGTIDDIQIGDKIVFEEINNKGQIQSFPGLKNFVKLSSGELAKDIIYSSFHSEGQEKAIYIFDNHNHALFFRYQELLAGNISKGIDLIHIDQHTDMNINTNVILSKTKDIKDIFHFVNYQCNVGNFITPAIQDGLISKVTQINTEYSLSTGVKRIPQGGIDIGRLPRNGGGLTFDYILDIDLDFRHPQMGIEEYSKTIEITKNLISQASLVTIATSPYFLDQTLAIKILKDIFN